MSVDLTSTVDAEAPSTIDGETNAQSEANRDEEEEEESGSSSEDEGDDDEAEDEAEEIARRLTAQLWADIQQARAEAVVPPRPPEPVIPTSTQIAQTVIPNTKATSKDAAAISTIKTVLLFAATDPLVHSTLSTTIVPGFESTNVFEMLQSVVKAGTVDRDIAGPLSQVVVQLARSELLFSPLPVVHLKRKRDGDDLHSARPHKRPMQDGRDLQTQLVSAVGIITQVLNASTAELPVNASIIASIQHQLHQVFLFAVTSSTVGGDDMTALQEISGLIQVLGVLSGVQIVQPTLQESDGRRIPNLATGLHTDIETAVYPCLISDCNKTFARLYNLRTHQRIHASHRPFRCSICPASFARNHDMKRHERGHEHVAYKCLGCMKVFSRRDAIKRHKSSLTAKAKREDELAAANVGMGEHFQGDIPCVDAEVEEVELEGEDKNQHTAKEGRRARLWNGVVNGAGEDALEEGELPKAVLESAQFTVTSLHGLLQRHVVKALGGDVSSVQSSSKVHPTNASTEHPFHASVTGSTVDTDASLASLIARITDVNNAEKSVSQPGTTDSQAEDSSMEVDISIPADNSLQGASTPSSLSGAQTFTRYGLNADQKALLEQAIANATAAAQAQAEAEALLEEEDDEGNEDDEDDEGDEERNDVVAGGHDDVGSG